MMLHTEMVELAKQVNSLDFDHPFELTHDGTLLGAPKGVYAPEVWHVDAPHPYDIDGYGDEWEPLGGMTGQYSYNGAVMHASEYIGCCVVERLLELCQDEPQTFVMVTVEVMPEDEEDEPEPAGWAIMHRVG